jgi:nitroreductase
LVDINQAAGGFGPVRSAMARRADHEIEEIFLRRWSPRAMSGQAVSEEALMQLFEAARWAPSSANAQPWRFVYARIGTEFFARFFDLLVEGNKSWCGRAGVLVVVLSKNVLDSGRPTRTHSFDAGAAWMSLALQGSALGLVVHGMAGFDYDRARAEIGVPEEYDVEAMIAIGHPGKPEELAEKDRVREAPSGRRPVRDFVMEGKFVSG